MFASQIKIIMISSDMQFKIKDDLCDLMQLSLFVAAISDFT